MARRKTDHRPTETGQGGTHRSYECSLTMSACLWDNFCTSLSRCRRTCQASSRCRSLQTTSRMTAARLPDTVRRRCSSLRWSGSGICRSGSRCTHHPSTRRRIGQEHSRYSSPRPNRRILAVLPPGTRRSPHSLSASTTTDTCWPRTLYTTPHSRPPSICLRRIQYTSSRRRWCLCS